MAGPGIEVERKFKVGADGLAGLQGRIAAAGGALVRRLAFTDAYHDTPDHRLTCDPPDPRLLRARLQWALTAGR